MLMRVHNMQILWPESNYLIIQGKSYLFISYHIIHHLYNIYLIIQGKSYSKRATLEVICFFFQSGYSFNKWIIIPKNVISHLTTKW